MSNKSTRTDAPTVGVVQLPAGKTIFQVLGEAFDRKDAESVRELVPSLSKKELASLFFHATRRAHQMRAQASWERTPFYGDKVWGRDAANVPVVVLSATRKMRIALMLWDALVRDLDVSRDDAERIVAFNIASDIEDGTFWMSAPYAGTADIGDGCNLSNARRRARRSAHIFGHRAQLRAAHCAAQAILAEAGLSWDSLAEYARGNHGNAHAIEKQQQAEREALAAA